MENSLSEKVVSFLQSLSSKALLGVISSSFLIASLLSLGLGYLVMPGSKNSEFSSGENRLDYKVGPSLSPADYNSIISRNIFNSEGKVGDSELEPTTTKTVSGSLVKTDLPYKIIGLIFAGDPYHGLVLLEHQQRKRVKTYVAGDQVEGGATLTEIYEDRVIFDRGGQREYLDVDPFELVRSRRKVKKKSQTNALSRIATRPPADTHKEDGFERKGTEIRITEEYKRSMLNPENLTKILQDAKAVPNLVNGELIGFKLTRIREDSVYEKAGFQNEDVVEEINGIPLRDAAGAIRLLQQMKSSKEIEVRIRRSGTAMDMNVTIQ